MLGYFETFDCCIQRLTYCCIYGDHCIRGFRRSMSASFGVRRISGVWMAICNFGRHNQFDEEMSALGPDYLIDLVHDLIFDSTKEPLLPRDADKRRSRREAMARSRARMSRRIETLQRQEVLLSQELNALMQRRTLLDQEHATSAYMALVKTQGVLLVEQDTIEAHIFDYGKLIRLLKSRVQSNTDLIAPPAQVSSGRWIHFQDGESAFFYRNETESVLAAIIQEGISAAHHLRCGLLHGEEDIFFGWKTRRSVEVINRERHILRFSYTRRILRPLVTLEDLQTSAWKAATSSEDVSEIHRRSVVIKVVETFGDDMAVVLRNTPDASGCFAYRNFQVIKRMWVGGKSSKAALVVSGVLDKEAIHEDTIDSLTWMKQGSSCMRFSQEDYQDTIEIEYVGCVECIGARHAAYLTIETGADLVRWEHMSISSMGL